MLVYEGGMDWSIVTKEHIEKAIQEYSARKSGYAEPQANYLLYEGKKLPAKRIRALAYSIATGDKMTERCFSGGKDTTDFFARFGYEVVQITTDRQYKYSVNEAVWLATAIMAYEKSMSCMKVTREDMYFKQSDIVKKAQTLTDKTVDAAKVSWWLNGDNKKHTKCYLRGDSPVDPALRRLSLTDEFPDNTVPFGLINDTFVVDGSLMTTKDIQSFVRYEYARIMKKTEIDYKGILDYLEKNQEIPYSNPDAPGITQDEKIRLLRVKQKGQAIVNEMKKIASRCHNLYHLDKCLPITWLDGSNTKTRKYLWVQMKYQKYSSSPVSVSVFVEKNNGIARYRVSLEIKNDDADETAMKNYHKHLDMPKEDGMVYVTGSNKWGNPEVLNDTVGQIQKKINEGVLGKIQLCIYVEQSAGKTNEQYDTEVMNAVRRIIPYYEYVVWENETNAYWPDLKEYDPGINKKEWEILLRDSDITSIENLKMFRMILETGGESTCANLAEKYGNSAAYYNSLGSTFSIRVHKRTNCPLCVDQDRTRYYTIPFIGRNVVENGKKRYSWKLRTELKEALQGMDLPDIDREEVKPMMTYDKNMILYGPPGTGKTYSTAIYAVAICDSLDINDVKSWDYDEVMVRYRELLSEDRIAFTTFHQSYGYEEFIEGIKPVLNDEDGVGYTIEDGIFKSFCKTASMPEHSDIDPHAKVWKVVLRLESEKENYHNSIKAFSFKNDMIMFTWSKRYGYTDSYVSSQILFLRERMKIGDIVVSYEGNGTDIDAIGIVTGEAVQNSSDKEGGTWTRSVKWIQREVKHNIRELNGGKYMNNFDIQELKRVQVSDLLKLVEPQKYISSKRKNYVFVVDEINRGNISKIFGELITLIEDTKREGMDEEVSAVLPYSGEKFSIPSNVYILGTMNTADRSIALMDTALRRRFQFEEMMPDADVLRAIGADHVEDLDVAAMLEKINERITFLYDREHTIGHAFFTKLADSPTIETLQSIFEKSVIPLLQEYFYEDYQKIQLVLGDNGKTDPSLKFILDETVKVKDIFKGNADDVIDLPEKKYSINKEAFANLESYKQII